MTGEEAVLWEALRGNQLGGLHFRRQQLIDGFIADFYCHAAALVVVLHQAQAGDDRERDRIMSARALRVLRVPAAAVRTHLACVLRQIVRACSPAWPVSSTASISPLPS